MKRLAIIFLLILFVLPGCERRRYIEVPAPSEPPNPAVMEPTVPMPSN